VDATWGWGPPNQPSSLIFLSSLLSLSLLSYPSPLTMRRLPPSPRASPARLAVLARGGAAARFPGSAGPRRSSSSFGLLRVPVGAQGRHSVRRPRRRRTNRCRPDAHGDRAAGLLCFLASLTGGERCCRREVLSMRQDLAAGARGPA
jgi:hypothetical protein